MLNNKTILITGGTGDFGKRFAERVLKEFNPKLVIIYSRDEYKQFLMKEELKNYSDKLLFFIGDIRDKERLLRALDGVDIVVHAAALKQVLACEYNPIEAVKTNIHGSENIINAAIDRKVKKVIALSTDKAVQPANLYGATKMVSDRLFISANFYTTNKTTSFSVVRYGNVAGSRGSVIPVFKKLIEKGEKKLPITDFRMTRFWITRDEGVNLVFKAIERSKGGEIFVSKIPSFKIVDLAKAMLPDAELVEVGIRPGEKLHEVLIAEEDSWSTYEYEDHFVIYPRFEWWDFEKHFIPGGKKVRDGFRYTSENNEMWLTTDQLREFIKMIDIAY